MTDTLTKSEYEETIDTFADLLLQRAETAVDDGDSTTVETAAEETVEDQLLAHEWFQPDYFEGALYGSIIEHSEAEPERYQQWSALLHEEGASPVLKCLAYVVMEADVLDRVLDD